jgi:hypothetical protein
VSARLEAKTVFNMFMSILSVKEKLSHFRGCGLLGGS